MMVVSGDIYDSRFPVDGIFTHNLAEPGHAGYWLGPEQSTATFVLNLGCQLSFDGIQIVNTHNAIYKDRSTKRFR